MDLNIPDPTSWSTTSYQGLTWPALTTAAATTLTPTVAKALTTGLTKITDGVANATAALSNTTSRDGTLNRTDAGEVAAVEPKEDYAKLVNPFIIPIAGLVIGGGMMQNENIEMYGKLVLYFGAQSFMNIFMSFLQRQHVTVPKGRTILNATNMPVVLDQDLTGCPAGFLLTALQQIVSFVLFIIYYLIMLRTSNPVVLKPLETVKNYLCVIVFGCVFAANIALNNFSLGYISVAVNLIIRSCLPLSTYLSQQAMSVCGLYQRRPFKIVEILLMVVGVVCATVFTYADSHRGGGKKAGASAAQASQLFGVFACACSLLCGSVNLALAGVLGDLKFNVLDTCAYMAIPATLFLAPVAALWSKAPPPAWRSIGDHLTDVQIFSVAWEHSSTTIALLFLSGVFSFMYNICQFTIVHTLSPSATAFGGNFNKAALTFMTLLLPFLQEKEALAWPWNYLEWIALVLNIIAFSIYSYLQVQAKAKAAAEGNQPLKHDSSDSEEDESSTEESSA